MAEYTGAQTPTRVDRTDFERSPGRSTFGMIVGVLVGGAIGAGAALLFAPKRGQETRSDVMGWTRNMEHRAADKVRSAGSTVAGGIRQIPSVVSQKAPEYASKVVGAFRGGTDVAHRTADTIQIKSEEAASTLDQAADNMGS